MNVKCLIIDDEPLAIKVIANHVDKIPWLTVANSTTNPLEGIGLLKRSQIDMLFLDIQMPELNGLEFMGSLRNPPAVIFTTAFRQFAAESYELDALDYLIKPIAFPRFLTAVNKYLERYGKDSDLPLSTLKPVKESRSFFIKQGIEMIKIEVGDILYIEGMKDYVQIHLAERRLVYKARISNLEEELLEDGFLRVHKSFLVPESKIDSVTPVSLKIAEHEIPIGRTFKNIVFKRLGI